MVEGFKAQNSRASEVFKRGVSTFNGLAEIWLWLFVSCCWGNTYALSRRSVIVRNDLSEDTRSGTGTILWKAAE